MSAKKNFCMYPMIFFQDELMQNWELAKDMKLLNRINPLI